jgi:hypothetical protein
MIEPNNENEWGELFRKYTPETPVPPEASAFARMNLQAELQKKKQFARNARSSAGAPWVRWGQVRDFVLTLNPWASLPTRAWFSMMMAFIVVFAVLFVGIPPQRVRAATVRIKNGTASILRANNGSTSYLVADSVSYLEPGDEITVGSGTATVTYLDGQTTQVLSGARVKLVSVTQEGDSKKLQLAVWQGRMLLLFTSDAKPGDSIEVISPSSTASVQTNKPDSAAIIVDVRPNGDTSFKASEGSASVSVDGRTVNVQNGLELVANAGRVTLSDRTDVAQLGPVPSTLPTATSQMSSGMIFRTPTPDALMSIPFLIPTSTFVPLPTDTSTPLPTQTTIPTYVPLPLPTATYTPVVPTLTPGTTLTATELPTETPVPQTPTATSNPAPTSAPAPTVTAIPTPSVTPMPTETPVLTVTATTIPSETPTPTPSTTPILTDTPVPTATTTVVPSETPGPTPSETPTPTETSVPIPTDTAVPTALPSPTATPILTTTIVPTVTLVPTITATPGDTSIPTATPGDRHGPKPKATESSSDVVVNATPAPQATTQPSAPEIAQATTQPSAPEIAQATTKPSAPEMTQDPTNEPIPVVVSTPEPIQQKNDPPGNKDNKAHKITR